MLRTICAAGVFAAIAAPAFAIPVATDLSSWTAEGAGNWNLESGNNGVLQTINGNPTVFFGPGAAQGTALGGTIEVQTNTDDDFIGFVLGYDSGELTSASADFILVDWKKANQSPAVVGLALSRVTGPIGTTPNDAWEHTGSVTELARATTLGSTGWVTGTEYTFDLEFSASSIRVYVDGNLELDVSGSFSNGAFGFYNYSQQTVRYAGITEEELPPEPGVVPLPAALPLFGAGLAALGLVARRRQA